MSDERFPVSREEIGILMSYATRPNRVNEELIERLVSGVTGPELIEITSWIGLPESTAARLVEANRPASTTGNGWLTDARFRRAIVTVLVVMVVGNLGFALAAGFSGVGFVVVSGAGIGVGYLLHRLITAIGATKLG